MTDRGPECLALEERIVEDAFAPEAGSALRSHLERCPRCRRSWDGYRWTARAVRAAFAGEGGDLRAAPGRGPARARLAWIRPAAVAAAALALVAVGLWWRSGGGTTVAHHLDEGARTFRTAGSPLVVHTAAGPLRAETAEFRVEVKPRPGGPVVEVSVLSGTVRWELAGGVVRLAAGERRSSPGDPTEPSTRAPPAPAPPPASSEPPAPPPVVAAAEAPRTAALEARVLDAAGAPLRGIRGRTGGVEAISGPDGRLRLEILWGERPEWDAELELWGPAHALRSSAVKLRVGETAFLGDLTLEPGGTVRGRVLDRTGRPVRETSVLVTRAEAGDAMPEQLRRGGPEGERLRLESFQDGGPFRIEGVPVGPVRVWAVAPRMSWAFSDPVTLIAGAESADLRLVLEPASDDDVIEGVVVDPEGRPVAHTGYEVSCRTSLDHGTTSGTTDEEGRFRVEARAHAPHEVRASDLKGRWRETVVPGVQPGTTGLVVRLAPPRFLDVRARARTGEALTAFEAEVGVGENEERAFWTRGPAPEGGSARLPLPARPFFVRVRAEGLSVAVLGPFDPDGAPAASEAVLDPLPGVAGRVVAGGHPVPGARVSLCRVAHPNHKIVHNGFPVRIDPNAVAEAAADAEGRFRLTLREDGEFLLRATAIGLADGESGPHRLSVSVGLAGVELPMSAGGVLEGRVLVPEGRSPAGTIVGINRGDGRARTQRVGPKGRFRFELLTAGRYMVERRDRETSSSPGGSTEITLVGRPVLFAGVCDVVEGRTTVQDLDLRGRPDAAPDRTLVGRLLLDGRAPSRWEASLWPPSVDPLRRVPPEVEPVPLDDQGTFRVTAPEPGRFRLTLTGEVAERATLFLTELVVIGAGGSHWELDLPTGRLEGRKSTPPRPGDQAAMLVWMGEGERRMTFVAPYDAQGAFVIPRAPAGRWRAVRLDPARLLDDPRKPAAPDGTEVEVPAGGRAVLTIP
jgi:hypothetical protein